MCKHLMGEAWMVFFGHNLLFRDSRKDCRGFTLIELLVVISIISLLMGILLPALVTVRHHAKTVLGMQNQRQVTDALSLFSADNEEKYPESVATIGRGSNWHWQDPRMITGYLKRTPRTHRSISEYLGSYIKDAGTIVCPLSPSKHTLLKDAWKTGDDWDNPETIPNPDPFIGSYCFYWNYVGYRGAGKMPFIGPRTPSGASRSESKLLMSCYFGFSHWRSPAVFGSCEKFTKSAIIPETFIASSYWTEDVAEQKNIPKVKLSAAYTDGHVETFLSTDTVPMKVSIVPDGSIPYPDDVGPGIFFLPANAVK